MLPWLRSLRRALILLLVCIGLNLHGLTETAKLRDSSQQGSPLAISGKVAFTEDGSQGTPYSVVVHASARNVSSQQVLLFKVSVEIMSTGAPAQPQEYSNDYYFSSELFEPKAEVPIPISGPRYGPRVVHDQPLRISAMATVEYVQFADGTSWGDADSVEEAIEVRQQTMSRLKVLQDAYERSGDNGFITEMMSNPQALPAIASLQGLYTKKGVDAAEETAWKMIDYANEHARHMKSESSTKALLCGP